MSSTIGNLIWKFSESVSSQAVTLVVSIIIARILSPADYGMVAMVFVFTSLAQVFVDGGFSSALIQKKDADDLDFSSVFYFSLLFSFLLYFFLFVAAPYIAEFYGTKYSQLTLVFRILGIKLIFSSIDSVQRAYVQKRMMFRNFFWATLVGTIISGCIGVVLAFWGCGVWALVAQNLTATLVNTVTLYFLTRKKPILAFSIQRLKKMLGFGSKMLGTNLLITGYVELRMLIIGKVYSAADLAYFDRARQFPHLFVANINNSIGAVLFPKLSLEQDNKGMLKASIRKSLRFTTYIICPLLLGLAAVAEPLVRLLLTEKWLPCVSIMQLLCIVNLFQPIYTANTQAIKAIGESNTIFKVEIIKKITELITLLFVMKISVMAIVLNMVFMASVFNFVFIFPNQRFFNYKIKEQLSDIAPGFLLGIIMALAIYSINIVCIPDIVKLLVQLLVGILVYFLLSKIFNVIEYKFLKTYLKGIIKK